MFQTNQFICVQTQASVKGMFYGITKVEFSPLMMQNKSSIGSNKPTGCSSTLNLIRIDREIHEKTSAQVFEFSSTITFMKVKVIQTGSKM